MAWLAVALGGALGSMARHWVNLEISHRTERAVPYATLTVNIIGCFVIGALAGMVANQRLHLTPTMRSFLFVGVLGGFTTFSSFGLDTFTLGHGGNHAVAAWNVVGHCALGLGAVWLGYYLAFPNN